MFCGPGGDERGDARDAATRSGSAVHLGDRVELPDHRAEAPAGDRQGAGDLAETAHPRRADRAAGPGRRSNCCSIWCAAAAAGGTAVVYITHRLAEVRELADRVTVLRDGKLRGTADVAEITDDELLALIVGRQLESTFPPKLAPAVDRMHQLSRCTDISGDGFADVTLTAAPRRDHRHRGRRRQRPEQPAARAGGLAELRRVGSRSAATAYGDEAAAAGVRLPAGRPASRGADDDAVGPGERRGRCAGPLHAAVRCSARAEELRAVGHELEQLAVKTPSPEAVVSALSGGNQQKVVLARALLSQPAIADRRRAHPGRGRRRPGRDLPHPARGVGDGVPVVVASSDAKELEGLCDRVIVMSRGQVVADLIGAEITEERIVTPPSVRPATPAPSVPTVAVRGPRAFAALPHRATTSLLLDARRGHRAARRLHH